MRTGIAITDISAPDSVMTFDVAFERDKPGWPKLLPGRIRSAPALAADVDGAGPPFTLELLVPVQRLNNTGALYVFRPDGTDFLDGDATPTPFAATTSGILASPCVRDVDGLAGNEIVFTTSNGTIYAFHANGTEVLDGDANPLTIGVVTAGFGAGVRAQPILAEVDGTPGLEIVLGGPANLQGSSLVRVLRLAGGTVDQRSLIVGEGSESPAVSLDFDGHPNQVLVATRRAGGEDAIPGLYLLNWEILSDPLLDLGDPHLARVADGQFSAPVAADLEGERAARGGRGRLGRLVPRLSILDRRPHPGRSAAELRLGGRAARVAGAVPGRGARADVRPLRGRPRAGRTSRGVPDRRRRPRGRPLLVRSPALRVSAPSRGAVHAGRFVGIWAPLVADVDGDSIRDVIPILPDGRRLAFRGDSAPIHGFPELGSTGLGAPPIPADLTGTDPPSGSDLDASAQVQIQINVKVPSQPVPRPRSPGGNIV